ncbi:MAG: YigZ family protein [Clostridia bacterium]
MKKSKFYSYIYNVNSLEQINELLKNIKLDNKKARHIVYGYELNINGNVIKKYSNDNEPQATGINAAVNMLEKENITNYLVVIVRYFGGTLLGRGLLLRSYFNSFKIAYENSKETVK